MREKSVGITNGKGTRRCEIVGKVGRRDLMTQVDQERSTLTSGLHEVLAQCPQMSGMIQELERDVGHRSQNRLMYC